jgi:hypothetical protein
VLCAGLGGEHAEDGGAAADVEDDLVLEEVGVVVDGVAVALGADLIFLWKLSGKDSAWMFWTGSLTSISSWIPWWL